MKSLPANKWAKFLKSKREPFGPVPDRTRSQGGARKGTTPAQRLMYQELQPITREEAYAVWPEGEWVLLYKTVATSYVKLMNSVVSSAKSQLLFRVITIVCAIVVSSYILFEVLDLDGSNWPLAQNPGNGSFLVATEPIEIKPTALARVLEGRGLQYDDCSSQHEVAAYSFVVNETRISGLRSSRYLSHRAALPRSSIPDPSSLA